MADAQHDALDLVVARLRNFFHGRTPWQRTLWSIGTITGLLETVEYAEIGAEGGLPNDGMRYVAESMLAQTDRDLGVGTAEVRQLVEQTLRKFIPPIGKQYPSVVDRARLAELARRCDDGYLGRWATAIRDGAVIEVELVSRLVAAHLLDAGLSAEFLDRWSKDKGWSNLPELLDDAESLLKQGKRKWSVLLPLESLPTRFTRANEWLGPAETKTWLEERGWGHEAARLAGGLLVDVDAADPWAAVQSAKQVVTRASARVAVAFRTPQSIRLASWARVDGESERYALEQFRRKLEIPNFQNFEALTAVKVDTDASAFDDALELAVGMARGNPGTVITGGWAAIEGLLLMPGETGAHQAADRMAALVACSFARADLQTLAFFKAQGNDDLARKLKDLRKVSSRAQAREIERMLRDGDALHFPRANDEAAVHRLQAIIAQPNPVLARVRKYVADALRRLYNQRNLIMHGGSFKSCALATTLRTAAPLVGAGLDRIAFVLVNTGDVKPLELAARAEMELALAGRPGGRWLVDLLG